MRSTRSFSTLLVLAAGGLAGIAACSSNSNKNNPDAKILSGSDAATADASSNDASAVAGDAAPTPTGCDYSEQSDSTNDDNPDDGTGSPENTGLTFTSTPIVICGDVNTDHYDSSIELADYDAYTFSTAADADVLVTFIGPGGSAIDYFAVQISDMDGDGGEADYLGDHGVAAIHLPAGTYEMDVVAGAAAALTSAVHYKIKVQTDTPATRCPTGSGTPTYTESHDGSNNVGNDVWAFDTDFDGTFAVTGSTAEPTDVTIASATNYLFDGSAGAQPAGIMVNGEAPAYIDNDSYSIMTGATTNQMEVQVNWDFSGSDDFDWYLMDGSGNIVQQASESDTADPEQATVSVLPSTTYNLYVGLFGGSTPGTAAYSVTLCGEAFTF